MATSNGSSGRTDGRSTPARDSPRSNVSRKQISHSSTGDDVEMGRGAKSTDANDDKKTKKTRKMIVIASMMVILLALIIGLSVGLTHRKRNQSNNPSAPSDFSTLGKGTGVGSLSTPTMYSAPTTDLKDGLLPWTIQSFGTNVIKGYEGCDALRADLAEAAAYLANVIIRRNRQYGISYGGGFAVEGDWDGADAVASEMTGEAAPESAKEPAREFAADEADDAADDGGAEDETDYGTNNQVEGVDEADMVSLFPGMCFDETTISCHDTYIDSNSPSSFLFCCLSLLRLRATGPSSTPLMAIKWSNSTPLDERYLRLPCLPRPLTKIHVMGPTTTRLRR